MCGIAGELRLDGTFSERTVIERMLVPLRRRGPDHEGIHLSGPLAMGHRRLSIIDLSSRANQPMVDTALSLVLVFNGTIYNYPELRVELQKLGYTFFSHSDTEVILKAYAAWGPDCVKRLTGMFAFAIWNTQTHELFLGRDRLGIKPLYYTHTREYFRFASSTQALLWAGDVDTRIDAVALHHHLTLHAVVPAPRTLLQGIRKLQPAHTMTLDLSGWHSIQRYWSLQAVRPSPLPDEQEWLERVHDALCLAVKRRLVIADVPVGVLLSGGLDSSLLVGLLAETGVRDLKTYTVGFEDQPEERGSEFEYSDAVVERFGTDHHKYHIDNSEVMRRLPEAVDNMSEPMVAQDAVAFYLLAEQVSQDTRVVQSGQGADEVFGGYFWYPQMLAAKGDPLKRFSGHYFDRSHAEYSNTVAPEYVSKDFTSAFIREQLEQPDADTFMDEVLRLDVTTLIVDDPIKRVDNMTMAWGLEARVPFLDHELVELVMRMPPELKLRSDGKYPLKQIARGLIPDSVIDRPKGYFPLPALKYIRGPFLGLMREMLNSQACRQRGLFQRDYVERLLKEPEAHVTKLQGSKLWHLALLEMWLQRNVDAVTVV